MELQIKKSSLSLKGTRLNASLNETGQLDVSLGEDNFGNTGLIEMTSDGQKQSIFSTDQVLQVTDQGVSAREKTDEEINEEKSANEVFVKNSSVNEEELEVQLVAKLASGKIQDINNDGIINTSDVDELKQQILNQKQAKIEFIIDNSKEDNTEFLSSVIDQSDEKTTGGVLEKIIDKNDALVENVVEDLVDKNNNFLITQSSENNSAIKEKVFETIVSKETNNSAAILSKVMAKADTATVSSVINNITEKNENLNSSLSLKVMADFAEKNPLKLENLSENNSDEIQKLTVSAISVAKSNANDANLIAKVVVSAPEGLTNKVIEEVTKKSSDADQALSARVMKSVIEINPSKMDVINEENKQTMISQTIEAAKNQINTSNSDENLSVLVAEIIVEADADVATSVLQNLNDSNEEQSSDLTKSIFINFTKNENFEEKLETISENSVIAEDIVDTMVEDAIVAISNSNDTEILKNNDVVFAYNQLKPKQTMGYRIANGLFNFMYKRFNGINLTKEAPECRVLSKRVINFILQHNQPAISYRLIPATAGFVKAYIEYKSHPKKRQTKKLSLSIERGIKLMVSTTHLPMRFVTFLSLFGACANLIYSFYVMFIWFFKENVAPGWVSASLQMSGMFLLISLVLLVLGEYILHMANLSNEEPKYHVGQEFTSAKMTRLEKLNLEDIKSTEKQGT